jgi:hypothetical protein
VFLQSSGPKSFNFEKSARATFPRKWPDHWGHFSTADIVSLLKADRDSVR